MPGPTRKKIPGKLNSPPSQAEFDQLPLQEWCGTVEGVFYRLHGFDPSAAKPHRSVYFSRAGRTRFDPTLGPGTMCIGDTLAGVLLEIFDDRWGAVGDTTRSLTQTELKQWWVSLVAVPPVNAFFAHQKNLSKIGTDFQLVAGDHATARDWALRLARHPAQIDGIFCQSRHDTSCRNLALLQRVGFLPEQLEPALTGPSSLHPPIFRSIKEETDLRSARDVGRSP
jgi:hypothetical protein